MLYNQGMNEVDLLERLQERGEEGGGREVVGFGWAEKGVATVSLLNSFSVFQAPNLFRSLEL